LFGAAIVEVQAQDAERFEAAAECAGAITALPEVPIGSLAGVPVRLDAAGLG
jgi:hypothetical protein